MLGRTAPTRTVYACCGYLNKLNSCKKMKLRDLQSSISDFVEFHRKKDWLSPLTPAWLFERLCTSRNVLFITFYVSNINFLSLVVWVLGYKRDWSPP